MTTLVVVGPVIGRVLYVTLDGSVPRVVDPEPGLSAWFDGLAPRCSGYWEVRKRPDRQSTNPWTRVDGWRMWYDAVTKSWHHKELLESVPHEMFARSHLWRGLSSPARGDYDYLVPGPTTEEKRAC